jgi:hypothetical protein
MFEIGDKVKAFGNVGTVHSFSKNGIFLYVRFKDFDSLVNFRVDGKMFGWNKKPSLKKVKNNVKTNT